MEETFIRTLQHHIKEAREGDGTLLDLVCQCRNDQYFHHMKTEGKADLKAFSEKTLHLRGTFSQHQRAECAWD